MQAFPQEEHAKTVKDLDLSGAVPPIQRTLGLCWEIAGDTFTYEVSSVNKPFTKRGVLSTVNSIFDPLGMVSPVTVQGRALLRELSNYTSDWDALLPEERRKEWETWRDSLQDLKQLHIPRTYISVSLSEAKLVELCVFSDASIKAISAVAYLRAIDSDGNSNVGFVLGKAKISTTTQTNYSTSRTLCGSMAVEIADLIRHEIDLRLDAIRFYCDSKVVLGYIQTRQSVFMCMCITGFYEFANLQGQNNGSMSRPSSTQLTMPLEELPHLNSMIWHGSRDHCSFPNLTHSCRGEQESYELVCPEHDIEGKAWHP